jgi:carbon-monoxide dehydrogenase small subunit
MKSISITINGRTRAVDVDAGETLLHLLRRLGFAGVKNGCEEGACGACAVILNGRAVNACIAYAFQAADGAVETIESLGDFDNPHPLQQALADEGAVQCGYCIPGIILSAKALLDRNPHPTDEDWKLHLDGHLCRCTGYEKIQTALRKLAARGDSR